MRQRFIWLYGLGLLLVAVSSVDCGKEDLRPGEKAAEVAGDGGNVTTEVVGSEPVITPDQGQTPDPVVVDNGTPDPGQPDPGQPDQATTPDSGQPDAVTTPDPTSPPDVPGQPDTVTKDNGVVEAPTPPDADKNLATVNCASAPAPGAVLAPAPPAYTGGTCPTLKAGANTFKSKGSDRTFLLILPSNLQPNEKLPVLFLWHWLKATASKFLTQGDVQKSVDQQRFIAVIPEAKGDLNMIVVKVPWPFLASVPQARVDEEYTFFDDMLSCVSAQFNVNKECVGTAGVSAGALFTAQLASARSNYISSFISLSGGVEESAGVVDKVRPWTSSQRKLPALVLWGGAQDSCVLLNFEKASQKLQADLKKDGHFQIECVHNCKHAEPPITPRPGKSKYESLWDFFLRHPFWLKDGSSPFQVIPWPYSNVPWCGIGPKSSTIRTGSCPPPACPI